MDPPSTGNSVPVMNEADSLAKYAIAADVSLTSPTRPAGYFFFIISKSFSANSVESPIVVKIGVFITEGLIALTRIPMNV